MILTVILSLYILGIFLFFIFNLNEALDEIQVSADLYLLKKKTDKILYYTVLYSFFILICIFWLPFIIFDYFYLRKKV